MRGINENRDPSCDQVVGRGAGLEQSGIKRKGNEDGGKYL